MGGLGWNQAEFMPLSCLLKGTVMFQAAAAVALGEPESSSLLYVQGVGDEKQLLLGKGLGALFPWCSGGL